MTDTTEDSAPLPDRQDHSAAAPGARSGASRVRPALLVAAALLLAGASFGVGEAQAISARSSLSRVRGQLTATRRQLTTAQGLLAGAHSQLATAQATARNAQNSATTANARAQARYTGAEAKLASKTKKLDTLIGRIQASAISADGVYVVGQDIKAGTWHTAGDGGQGGLACYYATLNSTNTSDISDNNNFDGPETVSLNGVYAFQISGPCTWNRTGP